MTCPAAHRPHDESDRLACLRAQRDALENADRLNERSPVPVVWPDSPAWKAAS